MEISELYKLFQQHPLVTTDTRDCPKGSLFFALRGTSFDGNQFAAKALENGCAYAVVDNADVAATDARMVLVDDVLETLQHLAAHHRRVLGTPIVQITGTNGKTTTKELTAAVLARQYRVLATAGNFNNHIGVPKTLLRLSASDDIAVVETGANHPGEIAQLTAIVDPDCGLVTNVGKAHLEGFGSFEGVVRTKSELYDYLRTKQHPETPASDADEEPEGEVCPAASFVFLHADDTVLAERAAGLPAVTYGAEGMGFDIEGSVVACNPFLRLRWRTKEGEWHEVQTRLIGDYNLPNVLAACAVGCHFGVPESEVSAALEDYRPTNSRSEFRTTAHNRLVVDAYNANVSSMHAALGNFGAIDDGAKMMVLGEMRELGEASATAHAEIADHAARTGIVALWLVGKAFSQVVPEGFNGELRHFPDVDAVKDWLREHPVSGRLILVKGSNGTRLFELPECL